MDVHKRIVSNLYTDSLISSNLTASSQVTNNFIRALTPSIFDSWLFFNLYSNYFSMCQRRINCLNIYHLTYVVNNQMVFGKKPIHLNQHRAFYFVSTNLFSNVATRFSSVIKAIFQCPILQKTVCYNSYWILLFRGYASKQYFNNGF